MARPIEFDRDQVLRDAMLLFWRRGYNQTSVRDLADATQLQPGSLYSAFANKHTLFMAALDLYSADLERLIEEVLRSDAPPLVRIERFFEHILNAADNDPEMKGCLLVNTLLEARTSDDEMGRRSAEALSLVERTFAEVLREAALRGELAPGQEPQTLAKMLMTGIYGLRVYSRMLPRREPGTLRQIADSLLSVLRE